MYEFKCAIVSLCPEFGGEFASSQDVCVGEGGAALSACKGGSEFPTAAVDVNSHMTSSASRLARYGASKCACMMWSAPRSLPCCSMVLYVVMVEDRGFGGLVLSSIRIPLCMSTILVI